MKIYVVYIYDKFKFDSVYGVYKSEAKALDAMAELESEGFRVICQMFHVKH